MTKIHQLNLTAIKINH